MGTPTVITGDSLNTLYERTACEVLEKGKAVNVRGTKTLELHPCILHLTNPMNRTLVFPRRGNNPFTALFETLWVLSGTNSIEHLKFFLPRAGDFSDNGSDWRAGYGFRIFNWRIGSRDVNTGDGIDQFESVYHCLSERDRYSRQAIINLWDPAHDHQTGKKDYPCTNHLAFLVRKDITGVDHLDLTVTIRSNDVLWGMSSINVYEFTVMQELMAKMLGIKVGEYFHIANSMHMYTFGYNAEKNLPRVKKSLYGDCPVDHAHRLGMGQQVANYMEVQGVKPFEFKVDNHNGSCNYTSTMEDLRKVYLATCDMVDAPTLIDLHYTFNSRIKMVNNKDVLNYMFLYIMECRHLTEDANREWEYICRNMPLTDLQVSAEYWRMKKLKTIEPHDYRAAVDKCTTRHGA